MCLGTLCRVVDVDPDGSALVADGERRSRVSLLALTDPVERGQWLLVHCGLALAVVSAEAAEDARRLRGQREGEPR